VYLAAGGAFTLWRMSFCSVFMSHKNIVFSPAGTPLISRTVGELVAERPGRSRVFQYHGIDFCCQGGRTLAKACERKNISSAIVVKELEAESVESPHAGLIPAHLAVHELTEYIVETHHDFLNRELPRLHAMAARVAQVHGGHTPSLVEVFNVFCGLEEEMHSHMMKEERVLFPFVSALS
jgi:regulator of cell morphogenesis and NO signaling